MKKTLIIGASTNPERYAYKAAHQLVKHGHELINIGLKQGEVAGQPIQSPKEIFNDIDTVTLYLSAGKQAAYYDYLLTTKPKRVIFNPGAENPELALLLREHAIEPVEACTLVLLSTGQY
ncbi:CoA-binding protein [Sphingobacteriaceae bacterium WQ 2009]|uniref:CoA-binding protein n=1 Tax=Rhinopithecimicrobium faecis TaxID=2820698 RepID=A0A8T4H997_9SPHI|nr:CoA-binding protein [Sphingobacteriaceae bacterium WQ 2009]